MSILLVEIVPQGIIFGADRNVTWSSEQPLDDKTLIQYIGHTQRPKVLRWPNRRAVIGYVGVAQIGGLPADEWLYDFIGRNIDFSSLTVLAETLRREVEEQRHLDVGNRDPAALIIHLAGFELKEGIQTPKIWFIRNAYGMDENGYNDIRGEFIKSEEFARCFAAIPAKNVRSHLKHLAERYEPFWFHQGFDLGTFNTLETFLKLAFKALCQIHSAHTAPQTLEEWEAQLRMSILTYAAYFQAYRGPAEQFVGGGADVVSIPWPDND